MTLFGAGVLLVAAWFPAVKMDVRQGRPIVDGVFVNGQGPFRFLLDTGAQSNQLEVGLAGRLGLRPSFQVELVTPSGVGRAPGGRVARVELGIAVAGDQEFLFTGLEGVRALAPDIQGVLGQEFLGRFDYLLDFEHGRLVFGATPPDGPRTSVNLVAGRMTVPTSCGRLVLDSGTDTLILYRADGGGNGKIRTATGSASMRPVDGLAVQVGERTYRGTQAAVVAHSFAEEDGLLPARLLGSVFVSNSGKYIIADPRGQK